MSTEQLIPPSPQEVKKDLLGLDEGWKNEWLRPPEPIPLTPKPECPMDQEKREKTESESDLIELKSSVKKEHFKEENEVLKDSAKNKASDRQEMWDTENEEPEDDKDKDWDLKEETDSEYDGKYFDVFDENGVQHSKKIYADGKRRSRRVKLFPYDTLSIKNYTTIIEKQEPLEEISEVFKENPLKFEKQIYHQKILNKIFKGLDNPKLLQEQYLNLLRNETQLEIYSCATCEYQSMHKENLNTHLWLIHKKEPEEKRYQCLFESCNFKAKTTGGLKNHQLKHNDPSDVESVSDHDNEPLCVPDRPDSDSDAPLITRVKNKPKKKFSKKKSFKNPPRYKTDDEKARYECDICDIEIIGRERFIKHNKTHKDPNKPKRYICHICTYGATKILVKKHLLKVHNIETKGVHEMKKHKCPHCDYITDIRSCLNSHVIIHKKDDEVVWYKCDHCDFTTKHRVSWKNHMKYHEPNQEERKKYMCEICSKSFIKKQNLEGHMLIHKSIDEVTEIYKCAECSYQTKFKCHLITHKQKHAEAKFICDVCGFRTKRQGSYRMHIRLHKDKSELEMFKCDQCPYETRFKHDLRKHQNSSIHSILAKRAAQAALNPNKKKRKKRSKKRKNDEEPPKIEEPQAHSSQLGAQITAPVQPQQNSQPLPPAPEPQPVNSVELARPQIALVVENRPRPVDEDFVNRQRHIDDGVASRLFYQFSILNAQMQ